MSIGDAREERDVFLCFKKNFYLPDSCTFQFELGIPCTRLLTAYASDHICITILDYNKKKEGDFSMRDLKTYLSVAPVLSTLWFGSLAGLLIEINRFFPDALTFPFF